jgi:hypothetical protein
MPSADFENAQKRLCDFIDKTLSAIECDEFQLEILFHDGSRFRTQCSWRIAQGDSLLFGSGDVGGQISTDVLASLIGLKVVSASILRFEDTELRLERGFIVQVISDAVQFETWDAHLDVGWVIFSDGKLTIFPPPSVAADVNSVL